MTHPRAGNGWIAAAGALGAVLGASPFVGGAYDSTLWVPLGLLALIAAAALAVARPVAVAPRTRVALGAVAALGCWQLLSTLWAASPHSAFVDGDRTFALAGVLGLAVLLLRGRRSTLALVAGLAAGVGAVGLVVLVRLAAGSTGLFTFDRLAGPLGYTNAQAAVFAMGAWLAFGLSSGGGPRRAGVATGSAIALACLVVLVQSRGAVLASVVAAIVVLALARDRRTLVVHLVVGLVAVAAASPVLLDVYSEGAEPARLRWAALAIVVAGVVGGAVWGGLVATADRVSADVRRTGSRVLTGAVVALVVAGIVAGALNASSISDQVSAFTDVGAQPRAGGNDVSRLASGSGNRLDYWRVALDAYADHPLGGIGAGSYPIPYYQERRTGEDVVQPHSLELQALTETGPVGLLLVLAVIVAVATGVLRVARPRGPDTDPLLVGALGATTAFLAQTSVDWLHLIPGVAGMALVLCAALLTWQPARSATEPPAPTVAARRSTAVPVAVAAVLAVALLSLVRQGLVEHEVHQAQGSVGARPGAALSAADRALSLDGQDLDALYVRSGALARLGRAAEAEATLRRAIRIEPGNFTPWLLLGDARTRRGDLLPAAYAYGRALQLNPRDGTITVTTREAALRALGR